MTLERLGAHWAHEQRTTYGRPHATVELLYLHDASPGFDFAGAAARISMARSRGWDVILRVDWKPGQVFPAMFDDAGAYDYCQGVQQAATQFDLFALVCGNEPNLHSETAGVEMQPWWVARMVFGHTLAADRTDCAYQFAKTARPNLHILAPAVAPWSADSSGDTHALTWPDGRSSGLPHEAYQYDLSRSCYDTQDHVPDVGDIKFALHTYGRVGPAGTANGGANEPWTDVRGAAGAQFGSRWVQDALYYCRQGQLNSPYGSDWYPWCAVTEANTYVDYWPKDNYPTGWEKQLVAYVKQFPTMMALCMFVDQDLGSSWTNTAMTARVGREPLWNRDHDQLLQSGW